MSIRAECGLRLHTDRLNATRAGGENLRRVLRRLDLESLVEASEYGGESRWSRADDHVIAALIQSCACMLVVPTCGGFEYGIIEAQCCGVPVIVTADGGILEEVAGDAAHFAVPAMYDYTSYGARSFRVAAAEIASKVRDVLTDSALRSKLISRGIANGDRYRLVEHQARFSQLIGPFL